VETILQFKTLGVVADGKCNILGAFLSKKFSAAFKKTR